MNSFICNLPRAQWKIGKQSYSSLRSNKIIINLRASTHVQNLLQNLYFPAAHVRKLTYNSTWSNISKTVIFRYQWKLINFNQPIKKAMHLHSMLVWQLLTRHLEELHRLPKGRKLCHVQHMNLCRWILYRNYNRIKCTRKRIIFKN